MKSEHRRWGIPLNAATFLPQQHGLQPQICGLTGSVGHWPVRLVECRFNGVHFIALDEPLQSVEESAIWKCEPECGGDAVSGTRGRCSASLSNRF